MPEALYQRHKYIVVKRNDAAKHLCNSDQVDLIKLLDRIENGRKLAGKTTNTYIICNKDEPYADKVLKLILEEETKIEQV